MVRNDVDQYKKYRDLFFIKPNLGHLLIDYRTSQKKYFLIF